MFFTVCITVHVIDELLFLNHFPTDGIHIAYSFYCVFILEDSFLFLPVSQSRHPPLDPQSLED